MKQKLFTFLIVMVLISMMVPITASAGSPVNYCPGGKCPPTYTYGSDAALAYADVYFTDKYGHVVDVGYARGDNRYYANVDLFWASYAKETAAGNVFALTGVEVKGAGAWVLKGPTSGAGFSASKNSDYDIDWNGGKAKAKAGTVGVVHLQLQLHGNGQYTLSGASIAAAERVGWAVSVCGRKLIVRTDSGKEFAIDIDFARFLMVPGEWKPTSEKVVIDNLPLDTWWTFNWRLTNLGWERFEDDHPDSQKPNPINEPGKDWLYETWRQVDMNENGGVEQYVMQACRHDGSCYPAKFYDVYYQGFTNGDQLIDWATLATTIPTTYSLW